jgi:hypothetical protein
MSVCEAVPNAGELAVLDELRRLGGEIHSLYRKGAKQKHSLEVQVSAAPGSELEEVLNASVNKVGVENGRFELAAEFRGLLVRWHRGADEYPGLVPCNAFGAIDQETCNQYQLMAATAINSKKTGPCKNCPHATKGAK